MKIMKKSIIIPAFALLIGASLAGSVTGTIAWYQYSTRVNAAYVGVSGGASGNLQMRIRGNGSKWGTRLTKTDIEDYLKSNNGGEDLRIVPVTPGPLNMDDSLLELDPDTNTYVQKKFNLNPRQGYGPYAKWLKADSAKNFVNIPLELRYIDRDGHFDNGTDDLDKEKEVYLSDLVLQAHDGTDRDISSALRFHVSSYDPEDRTNTELNHLISKFGGTTVTNGKLDLDGNGEFDKAFADDKYNFNGSDPVSAEPVIYGAGQQFSYAAVESLDSNGNPVKADGASFITGHTYFDSDNLEKDDADISPILVKTSDDDTDLTLSNLKINDNESKSLGKTIEYGDAAAKFLCVDITIWVEGWQKFPVYDENGPTTDVSSIWDASFVGASFDIGFEFAVQAK